MNMTRPQREAYGRYLSRQADRHTFVANDLHTQETFLAVWEAAEEAQKGLGDTAQLLKQLRAARRKLSPLLGAQAQGLRDGFDNATSIVKTFLEGSAK